MTDRSSSRPPPSWSMVRTRPTPSGVVLVLEHVGFEWGGVGGLQQAVVVAGRHVGLLAERQDLAVVLGLALVVLLPVGHAHLGSGRHDHAGLGAVDAGFEGSLAGA